MFGFGADMLFHIPGILLALTVHEYAHARAAVSLGDPTPRYAGRLTLNPIPHLDPIGLIMLWLFRFGWAKPVPVNPYNLRNGRRDMLAVSLAGPAANILLALLTAIVYSLSLKLHFDSFEWSSILVSTYQYNLIFAVFNLIPLPPLDGAQIVSSFLSGRQTEVFERIAPYSPFILMGLVYIGVIGKIVGPGMNYLSQMIGFVVSLIL
ncbi:MAG TPA: site-2 protease family protein [Selenomonadales bacterium]|nr:site-2 protease family protein [Selenomonadales bacterium]